MSQSDDNYKDWRAQAHASAAQKLADALAQRHEAQPLQDARSFQENLGQIVEKLAMEELLLIQRISGVDILEKLRLAMSGQEVSFAPEQAHQLGAFVDDALSQDDASQAKLDFGKSAEDEGA